MCIYIYIYFFFAGFPNCRAGRQQPGDWPHPCGRRRLRARSSGRSSKRRHLVRGAYYTTPNASCWPGRAMGLDGGDAVWTVLTRLCDRASSGSFDARSTSVVAHGCVSWKVSPSARPEPLILCVPRMQETSKIRQSKAKVEESSVGASETRASSTQAKTFLVCLVRGKKKGGGERPPPCRSSDVCVSSRHGMYGVYRPTRRLRQAKQSVWNACRSARSSPFRPPVQNKNQNNSRACQLGESAHVGIGWEPGVHKWAMHDMESLSIAQAQQPRGLVQSAQDPACQQAGEGGRKEAQAV